MPTHTAYTTLAFGASSLLTGICILFSPGSMLSTLSLSDASLPAIRANALAAVAMGIYYTLAFVQDNRAFFVATVPMRILRLYFGCRKDSGCMWRFGRGLERVLLVLCWRLRSFKQGLKRGNRTRRMVSGYPDRGKCIPAD